MKRSFFLYSNGTLKRKDNTITFINEKDEKRDIPIEMVDDFYVMSEMSFNTKFINYISQFGIPIHFFNYYTFYTGSFYPREINISGQLLVKQVEHYTNEQKRVEIAREFIEGASFNIYRNLRYYNGRGKDLKLYMDQIEELRKHLKDVNNVEELMGYEGNIRKIYYEAWNSIVNQEIDFEKRVKNPPDNMINSLISFVNTLFYTKVLGEIYKTQLNPTVSYLHQPSTRRFSLSLDISEVFKPLIVDRLIFSLLNKNQITEKSFVKDFEYLRLKEDASKLIVQEFEDRLKQIITHKDLNRKISYQYLVRLECYKLIKHLLGEKNIKLFKCGGDKMYVVAVYDISLDEKGNRNWRKIFGICKRYLHHIQNSVFEGELSEVDIQRLKYEVSKYIRDDLDSFIIFKSRNERWMEKEMLGLQEDKTDNFL